MADLRGAGRLLAAAAPIVALLAVGPFAAGAAAAKTRVAVGHKTLKGVGASGSAQANCPRGTVAVSGGFGQRPPANAQTGRYIDAHESHRVGARAWKVTGVLNGGRSTLTAYAYCRVQRKPKQIVRSFPLSALSRSEATAIATCPNGLKAISGGFRLPHLVPGQTSTFLTEADRFGKHQWVVTGVRSSATASSDGFVTAYGYCSKGPTPRQKTKTVPALSSARPTSVVTADTDGCAKGTKPLSGGVRAPYTQIPSGSRGLALVTDSLLIGSAWRVSALPFGTEGVSLPVSLTSIVYCR
jgi:hypothetical protein